MFSCKNLVLFLAMTAVSVTARPSARRCHHKIADAVSSIVESSAAAASQTPVVAAVKPTIAAVAVTSPPPAVTSAPVADDDDEESTTKTSATSTKTTKTSSKAAAPTATADDNDDDSSAAGPAKGGLMKSLFPLGTSLKSWSTAAGAAGARVLSDATFKPTKMISALAPNYVTMAGKKAMQAHYPKGSYTFTHQPQGGLSFYAPGPVDLTQAKEVTFGYSVYFPAGFQFNLGGKLPGIYGGNTEDGSASCSGGRRSDECFSARLMWRPNGAGEMYTYLPPGFNENQKVCKIPNSDCNPTYGASIGRGIFTFKTGEWNTVSERVKLNTVGKADGELELFVGGKSVLNINGLVLRDRSGAGRIRGIQMQTFFGGSKPEWGSPKDQDVFFSDFSVAVTENL